MPNSKANGCCVISPTAKPMAPDIAARIFFGLPLERLAEDIKRNPNGKYDDLFEDAI